VKWNRGSNLTGLPLSEFLGPSIDRLLIEPLIAVSTLHRLPSVWIDLGSGGGSPAIPMRMALDGPTLTMVESRWRKSAFLREAIRALPLVNSSVFHGRVEDMPEQWNGAADLVTVRALKFDGRVADRALSVLKEGGTLALFGTKSLPERSAGVRHATSVELPSQNGMLHWFEKARWEIIKCSTWNSNHDRLPESESTASLGCEQVEATGSKPEYCRARLCAERKGKMLGRASAPDGVCAHMHPRHARSRRTSPLTPNSSCRWTESSSKISPWVGVLRRPGSPHCTWYTSMPRWIQPPEGRSWKNRPSQTHNRRQAPHMRRCCSGGHRIRRTSRPCAAPHLRSTPYRIVLHFHRRRPKIWGDALMFTGRRSGCRRWSNDWEVQARGGEMLTLTGATNLPILLSTKGF